MRAVGTRNGGEVRRVRLAVLAKDAAERRSVVRHLEPGDGAKGVVVHDDPNHRNVGLDRGGEERRILSETAVSDQRHHDALGTCELGAERRRRPEPHGGVAAGRENGSRREDRKLLSHTVLVPAHIGGDQRVARQNLAHCREDAFRPHWIRRVADMLDVALSEIFAVGSNLAHQVLVLAAGGIEFLRLANQDAQRLLEIGHGADLHGVITADLARIDVNVDELRGWHAEREARIPRAAIGFRKPGAQSDHVIGLAAFLVDEFCPPEARHAKHQRMVVGQRALPHQAVRDRQTEVVDKLPQFGAGVRQDDAASGIDHRILRRADRLDDPCRGFVVDRRPMQRLGVVREPREQARVDFLGKDVHGHGYQHRSRPPTLGESERLLDDFRKQVRPLDAPGALHERPVDLILRGVGVEIHFLVRMLAVIVARHVARNNHHRDRIKRGVRNAGRGVGQPRPEVAQQHRSLALGARVAVGHVRRDLLVARIDELDPAARERCEHGDIGVPAQAEDVLDAPLPKVFHELVRNEDLFQVARLVHVDSSPSRCGRRVWGPVYR